MEQRERWYHLCCWGVPAAVAVALLATDSLGAADRQDEWCWIAGLTQGSRWVQIGVFYIPLVVAFGVSDLASNRYLRALYNLDLVMNALHWVTQREGAITLRPKAAATIQFPVPLQNSLSAFYGVGMLVPELLLIAGGWVWLRRRSA